MGCPLLRESNEPCSFVKKPRRCACTRGWAFSQKHGANARGSRFGAVAKRTSYAPKGKDILMGKIGAEAKGMSFAPKRKGFLWVKSAQERVG